MKSEFPGAVPEIPVAEIAAATAYYQRCLGFTLDWGDEELGLAGISKGNCRIFLANQEFRRRYGNVGPTLTWLNLDSKEVKRGNDIINLTAKEFQLLEYLMRNKNKVVSRADIAINVWDIDFDTNTNVIDVYINYVRNKVDKPFNKKLIQTQVGMGYILKDKE